VRRPRQSPRRDRAWQAQLRAVAPGRHAHIHRQAVPRRVIAGFARDILDRLPNAAVACAPQGQWGCKDAELNAYWRRRVGSFRDTVTWPPLIDPEWLKVESLRLALP
jgi:hypothetical protein